MFNNNYLGKFLDKLSYKSTDCKDLETDGGEDWEKIGTNWEKLSWKVGNDCNCLGFSTPEVITDLDFSGPNCQLFNPIDTSEVGYVVLDICKPNASPKCVSAVHNLRYGMIKFFKKYSMCFNEKLKKQVKFQKKASKEWCKKTVRGI